MTHPEDLKGHAPGRLLVAPSILSADFSRLGEEVKMIEDAGADWVHVDVMDGHFVPNLTIGPVVVKWLKKRTTLPLDVHLMITDPLKYAEAFVKAGAWNLTFHHEAVTYPEVVIRELKKLGVKRGVSVKPKTPVKLVFPYLKDINVLLIMTVEPGFGGQAFMPEMLPKIREAAAFIKEHNLHCHIEVDGGMAPETAQACVDAGANVLVAGSAVFEAADPPAVIRALKALRAPTPIS